MTLTLGGLTALLHEQLSFFFFAGRGSSVGRASAWYVAGRGFDPHVWHTVLGEGWS